MSTLRERLKIIQRSIEQSSTKVDRNPSEIALLAVTKNISPDKILEAVASGITLFGESRIQEAREKIMQFPTHLTWHLIGHLQTNKVKEALETFQMIQSVDSLRLAEKIHRMEVQLNKTIDILLEVNIGEEKSKFGFREEELTAAVSNIKKWDHLRIRGLMTIAPFLENLEEVRPYFKKMKTLFDRFKDMDILSMGMSHDFTIAIEEGSTMVRIGQAIFGK
ncbi:MAG: YggS family pyridoxal phosphate-dependent enzyme [Chlamydiae bacterium]|nr:YggS family pyridoxal phosphate-dependent enzyme [Chlamydiota bacterium]MBI3276350.1 YggS family pyridoxal phosphate-dependent enzyme [Chlamydiota bacterium]